MREEGYHLIGTALGAVFGFVFGCIICGIISAMTGNEEAGRRTAVDSIVYVDTVRHDSVIMRDSIIVRYKVVPIARKDTAVPVQADSILLPVTQKHYSAIDYDAWVSGYEPQLDSIRTYSRRSIITLPSAAKADRKRFGIGIQAGCGLGKDGLAPYIGLGLSYRLLEF